MQSRLVRTVIRMVIKKLVVQCYINPDRELERGPGQVGVL
jgi:hypothetical protein